MNDEWEVERFRRLGREFVVYHACDQDHGAPWEACDGHGPVSDWRPKDSKAPGELVLSLDRGQARFYDFEAAVKLARKDGWDSPPYKTGTLGERAARAARHDYEFLREWCRNEWSYVGVIVRCQGKIESLWGIESNADDYLKEVARELAVEICREFTAERQAARAAAHTALQARAFL